ncbi:MAG: hypothetical protein AAB882_01145 [Patescibacteria group bacterium]
MTNQERVEQGAVVKRIRFLNTVVMFIESIMNERGTLLKYKACPGFIHRIFELHNYGSFSFYIDIGGRMPRGNEVKMWYHPAAKYEVGLTPVLHVTWRHFVSDCSFMLFYESCFWQRAILKTIQRQKGISARLDHEIALAARRRRYAA